MKNLFAVVAGTVPFFVTGAALAQNGRMMNDGMRMGMGGWMGGHGGFWLAGLLVVAVGLVVWVVIQRRK